MSDECESVFHVTALSNFAAGFDKYGLAYDKSAIPGIHFPDRFFVLRRDELDIGVDKSAALVRRLNRAGDRVLVIRGAIEAAALNPNLVTGKGRWFAGTRLPVADLFLEERGALLSVTVEDAMAMSLSILAPELGRYETLAPRSMSVLPIAMACQASCRFCFSESSASLEQVPHHLDPARVDRLCLNARTAGARRFVITGGGEPGLVRHEALLELIAMGARYFPKTVLITNGVHLARRQPADCAARLADYAAAGLSVLAVSRHHHDRNANAAIMGLDTGTGRVLDAWSQLHHSCKPRLRLICVLQKGGIETGDDLAAYASMAVSCGIEEICFKELYVSTTLESSYHAAPENIWSRAHQVPLAIVPAFFNRHGFKVISKLPWGSPVLEGTWDGRPLRVAAYTEPSLFWERRHGIARSWNLMADGTCLASLEDPASFIECETEER